MSLLSSARVLLLDMASTFVFLVVLLVTNKIPALAPYGLPIGIVLGILFGIGQIGVELARKKPVGVMQWLSLALVIGFGGASLITHDPRFVMFKPSIIYVIVGVVMLKPGWMNRYLPPEAQQYVPDLGFAFGFVWAGLMFASAVLNLAAILFRLDVVAWASFMSIYAIASKGGLFLIQYGVMRFVGRRRFRAREAVAAGTAVAPAGAAAA
jgi:intracellular septation protein A